MNLFRKKEMSEISAIYLDSHATTPVDHRVFEEMRPYFTEKFGNASSLDHSFGYDASVAVQQSRESIAKTIGATMDEIIFTSGATESDNLALIGVMERNKDKGNHLITCVTEHKAILDTARHLESLGNKVTYLPVDEFGSVDLEKLKNAITDETVLISIMFANNEIGTIADISEIGEIAHDRKVLFHTDAAQAVGHLPIDVQKMNIDLMSFSSHKIYGPKGIGVLYVRSILPRAKLNPIMFGGGQEKSIRSGTLNVPGIVGFAKALEISQKEMEQENIKFKKWTDYMLEKFSEIGGKLNGHPGKRLVHNLNVRFNGIESKAIINSVSKKIAISAGSACTAQMVEPSHVLLALGLDEDQAHSSIRIGCGRFNTEEEIKIAIEEICDSVKSLKKISA
jgi:cysteine desulfurase